VLDAVDLECIRGDRLLFRALSLAMQPGQLLRVTGANGSGKTSLLRILCGLLQPTGGEVRWRGLAIGRQREEFCANLVFVGHLNGLKDDLTALENLSFAASLAGVEVDARRAHGGLASFGVAHCADLPAKFLSQGQRRRVALARLALSAAVPLWILDEPFSALDAAAVAELERMLTAHIAAGGMVVLTTHQEVTVDAQAVLRVDLDLDQPARRAA
jgi:heme exporter protein A